MSKREQICAKIAALNEELVDAIVAGDVPSERRIRASINLLVDFLNRE